MDTQEKTYWDISKLKSWDKNPRDILHEDFKRLKKQVETLGEYKPLLINEHGIVLGGNMRFKVYQELGWQKVWVSIVEAETEKEMLEYALSDNDAAGFYNQQDLAELVLNIPDLKKEDYKLYHIEVGKTEDLEDIVNKFAPSSSGEHLDQRSQTTDEDGVVECPSCGHKFSVNKTEDSVL